MLVLPIFHCLLPVIMYVGSLKVGEDRLGEDAPTEEDKRRTLLRLEICLHRNLAMGRSRTRIKVPTRDSV